MMRTLATLLVLLGFFVLVAAGMLRGFAWYASQPGPHSQNVIFEVPRGMGTQALAGVLAQDGVIDHPKAFLAAVVLGGHMGALKAGEYESPAGQSLRDLTAMLSEGRVYSRKITFPEGWSNAQIIEALQKAPALTGTIDKVPPEGSLLPETYQYSKNEARAAVLARMQTAMDKTMAALWPRRAPGLPFATPAEALVLASIVEKETGIKGERAKVAGVFVNRLRAGMMLQSDPTVIYAHTKGAAHFDRVLYDHLDIDSPYNTYRKAGLPPGPICNPGKSSLAAVLNPEVHDYFYFVADGTGGHVFAKTLDEHNANVAKWRAISRAAREKSAADVSKAPE